MKETRRTTKDHWLSYTPYSEQAQMKNTESLDVEQGNQKYTICPWNILVDLEEMLTHGLRTWRSDRK